MKLSEFIELLKKYPEKDPCRFYDVKNNEFLYYKNHIYSNSRIIIYLSNNKFISYKNVIYFLTRVNKSLEVEFTLYFKPTLPGVLSREYPYKIADSQTGTS
jgi:hypothetical protein